MDETGSGRDLRAIGYRVVAGLIGLFFLIVGAAMLVWPFGWVIESAAPEVPAGFDFDPTRWYAGMFGAFFCFFYALPLLSTLRRPRQKTGTVQYLLVSLVVVNIGSTFAFEEFVLVNWVMLVLFAAAYPEPRQLLRIQRDRIDTVMLAATVVGTVALIPFVRDALDQNTIDAGSELQKSGIYWAALWILLGTVIAGAVAVIRARGATMLASIVGAAFAFLGAASLAVPDHPGSWGVALGVAAIAAGGAVIAYMQLGPGRAERAAAG